MPKVDIILPIYNAYEFAEECIKSLLKYTDLINNRLLLIDDKSPDERMLPMLQKYAKENPSKNIVIIEHEQNLGFVKTVNQGMSNSENDVLLLNSDTEVTSNWLEKIITCAYQNEHIATVTPLTNNGTIASVPDFGVDNELPTNMTLEEYAEMIEKYSLHKFPEITTANGFCMFIKRSVIQEIGLFDEVTFGKGYGEENDFCYRALNHGYLHILCDNTFIYHKGTQSFKKENATSERSVLVHKHMEKLCQKHEIYVNKTDDFIRANPWKEIQENIRLNIELHKKKRILYLVNEWQESTNMTAGTSLHIKDIIEKARQEMACFILTPDNEEVSLLHLYLYTQNYSGRIYSFKLDINKFRQITYHNQTYSKLLETLFETFQFDLVHVHHFLFQTFDVIDIMKKYKTYSIITLHDLYLLCPSINMVYEDRYCSKIDAKNCEECFWQKYQIKENILPNWRKKCGQVLTQFDKIIAPSESTKKLFQETYPNLEIEVIEHGIATYKTEFPAVQTKDTFDIAFVGIMAKHKGSQILKELILKNKNSKIKMHVFGKVFDEDLEQVTENYQYHGSYQREELPQKLLENQIDLVCLFSVCPETYSYTLSETCMAKIPVLCYDLGAIADRVQKDDLGWLLSKDASIDEIYEKIKEIKSDKVTYQNIKENFKNYQLKTIDQMQEEYMKLYDTVKQISSEFVDVRKLNHYVAELNQIAIQELKIENENKKSYIEKLEREKQDFEQEEMHKSEYIKVLENIIEQKKQGMEALEKEVKRKNDTILYYENMRIIKFIKKLKKKGNENAKS